MKMVYAALVFGIMAFILAWGIVAFMQPAGKPWLLITGVLAYVVLFWRNCKESH